MPEAHRPKEENQKEDAAPFREPLAEAGLDSQDIYALKKNPDLLVRFYPFDYKDSSTTGLGKFRRGVSVFETLRDKYGIAVPQLRHIVGEENGEKGVYTVVDRIYGKNLKEASTELLERGRRVLDQMFTRFARYYCDVYEHGGDYWYEFGLKQIVYGHQKGETADRLYLVDVDPLYQTYDPQNPRQGYGSMARMFRRLAREMVEMESRLSAGQRFENARSALTQFLTSVPKDDPNYRTFQDAEEILLVPVRGEAAG